MFNMWNTDPEPNQVAKPLFNGNIASMFVNIPKLGDAHLYGYRYDQLNRIVSMDAFKGFVPAENGWVTNGPVVSTNYKERISYDPNGNILGYYRNGSTTPPPGSGAGGQLQMDNLVYAYNVDGNGRLINNRLRHVDDDINPANYADDIDDQDPDNYEYDQIGNLVKDAKEEIDDIEWTVYGKISSITKTPTGGSAININYTYDASGNRISKSVQVGSADPSYTFYVRDASGNVMAVYEKKPGLNDNHLTQTETHLYGSSRLGVYKQDRDVENAVANTDGVWSFERGNKAFELSNHLGNVLVTISDRKLQVQDPNNTTAILYYAADVVTAADNYPFGMTMPGRKYELVADKGYRFGLNGQEKSTEIHASGNSFTAEFWQYDARIGRRWNVDPKPNVSLGSYSCFGNNPIVNTDIKGDTLSYNTSRRQTRADLVSILSEKGKKYIGFDDKGNVSFKKGEFNKLSNSEQAKLLDIDGGLNLLKSMIESTKNFYYANSYVSEWTVTDVAGNSTGVFKQDLRNHFKVGDELSSQSVNGVTPLFMSFTNLALTRRGDEATIGGGQKPSKVLTVSNLDGTSYKRTFDGELYIAPGTFYGATASSPQGLPDIRRVPRPSVVYHELRENFLRVGGLLYTPAHTQASDNTPSGGQFGINFSSGNRLFKFILGN